ncbi:Metallo-hydrolase/oxidoreductase [Marasmius fiardii PR-910]|nr:Metallo-hydrolase/oxidoreductase [Marasmius fiardii PR-910]
MIQLPADVQGQTYIRCSALAAGFFWLSDRDVFEDSIDTDFNVGSKVPSLCFLLEHERHGKLLFDLGLRKKGLGYPPAMDEELKACAVDCELDICDLLDKGGLKSTDISTVIYSHLHFDHTGDLSLFPTAELILGEDSKSMLQFVYPDNPKSRLTRIPATQRVSYIGFTNDPSSHDLSNPCPIDYFKDGSLYLLDAPGHIPGHLNALVRVAPNSFILLAADCCHNRACYDPGVRLVSRENHYDIDVARTTVDRVKQFNALDNVVVILSHESERLQEMPMFPSILNEWAAQEMGRKRKYKSK